MSIDAVKKRYEAAYRRAVYQVALETETVSLSIGQYDALAEATLQETLEISRDWAILTPCNPRSELAREEINLFYLNELRYAVEKRAGRWNKATNTDPSGEWPDEPGFFIVDPDIDWITDLGMRFYQNALVYARLNEAPRLIWLL